MVPPDWKHPKERFNGQYRPLSGRPGYSFSEAMADYKANPDDLDSPPSMYDFMPDFAPGTATHIMMYEDTTEGTPISPAFATPHELAAWLVANRASASGFETASYDTWMGVIERSIERIKKMEQEPRQ